MRWLGALVLVTAFIYAVMQAAVMVACWNVGC